ncbi:MAG: hypothetical protein M3R06_02250 [Chloroflexota bacterium]|nr:hypothetical protein [Chloroflexota bacterium]
MRRISLALALLAVMISGLIAGGGAATVAQEATTADSTLVGTWLLDTDVEITDDPPSVIRFSADGGYVQVEAEGFVTLGVWEASGDGTATLTIVSPGTGEEGAFEGTTVIRATIEVDASGDAFTAQYTLEFIAPDGTSDGQYGPGTATGTRITVEAPGTTVGSFEDLFGQFEGEAIATPAA